MAASISPWVFMAHLASITIRGPTLATGRHGGAQRWPAGALLSLGANILPAAAGVGRTTVRTYLP